jgi:hypothetical protein
LHGHVTVNKEAGQAIGQGLSTIGSQVGLGVTMVGVSTAVAKAITKTGMPPLQKVGFIVGASLLGGVAHTTLSATHRRSALENYTNNETTKNISSSVSKFIEDSLPTSPLKDLLNNIELTDYILLGIIYIVIIQLLFKLYFKYKVNLNKPLLDHYINKIINLNKQMSIV